MATGPDLSSSSSAAAVPDAVPPAAAAKKDRHIVSWSAEVRRGRIPAWTIIAAQFKDKTARQCRRRTDNAVKNRFSTLCKRRAKDDDSYSENGTPCSNANAKRVLTQIGCLTPSSAESSLPIKHIRSCSSDFKENVVPNMRLFGQEKSTQDARQPVAIISSSNKENVKIVETQNLVAKTAEKQLIGVKREGSFLNKDDPKVATLLQQADLLSSLAVKIKTENTSQSMDEAWKQLQHHLVKKDDSEMSESSMSGMASLLDELDDLIVDPYENNEEDEQKQREQNGPVDEQNEPCNASSKVSKEVRSYMASDEKMDDCPVDMINGNSSLCTNMLSRNMEPCQGTQMPASENLGEVAEGSMIRCMESTPPIVTDFDDLIVDPYESEEEDEQKFREQSEQIDMHDEHSNGPSQTSMELPSDTAPVPNMEECPVDECRKDESVCISMLSGRNYGNLLRVLPEYIVQNLSHPHERKFTETLEFDTDADNTASEYVSKVAEDSMLQSVESALPVQTNFQSKECPEIPALVNLTEAAEDSKLQGIESTSPTHTVLHAKAGASVSPKFGEVGRDNKLPSKEFTSPAHTVPTFQPFEADMPTPKFTASERNFLLSVLELTSPGSKPETSQQPSCKRALLNSL
ncbi:hypothetical protein PR202_ga29089 [Eleusine coracana subsp. coracana]|uniref:Uncharacterized protein n=1 Tax=Eleusine coracana subsp. coracana TaxID=191504 RepID=A0AAV5DKS1_ELECO|nr:hypothetical protein PR202_ga29089 [Eleusine coracana subsp. coracana]